MTGGPVRLRDTYQTEGARRGHRRRDRRGGAGPPADGDAGRDPQDGLPPPSAWRMSPPHRGTSPGRAAPSTRGVRRHAGGVRHGHRQQRRAHLGRQDAASTQARSAHPGPAEPRLEARLREVFPVEGPSRQREPSLEVPPSCPGNFRVSVAPTRFAAVPPSGCGRRSTRGRGQPGWRAPGRPAR